MAKYPLCSTCAYFNSRINWCHHSSRNFSVLPNSGCAEHKPIPEVPAMAERNEPHLNIPANPASADGQN